MIRCLLMGLTAILFCEGCVVSSVNNHGRACQEVKETPILRHVVLFALKDDTTPEQTKEIENALRGMKAKADVIAGFEWGMDVSPQHMSEGFTHCFVMTFHSEADRDAYLAHPAHDEYCSVACRHMAKQLVVDYWAKR